ncbi:MAG: DegT/DnrJ/EryC1/StrS family aminotransferase [Nitrososphaeria archaeon]|nr:DegT/DnrJ/EryC1/StrS family aminotransferase [Nitrososphaeria archaeon]
MIPINKPAIGEEEKNAVLRVLESLQLTDSSFEGGKFVKEFEKLFAEYVGTKHAIAVNSGTSAILAALMALDLREGCETLVPGFTFASTATTSLFLKANVKFVDIELETYSISVKDLAKKFSKNSKVVLPVHLYGHPAPLDEIIEESEKHCVFVVEDAAQSLGSKYRGKMTGGFGIMGCFSLYGTKIVTCGEGGVVTTNDDILAEKLRMIRSHGQVKGYDSKVLGLNLRMPQMEAAIGIEQLRKIDSFIKARRKNAMFYNEEFGKLKGVRLPVEKNYAETNWSIYTVYVERKRNEIVQYLRERGVGATVYYPTPLNKMDVFIKHVQLESLPNCEEAAEHVLSLPVYPTLTEEERNYVVKVFKEAIRTFL